MRYNTRLAAILIISSLAAQPEAVFASDIATDLERVNSQIAEAEADAASYGGAIGTLALLRLQVLQLTATMLEQKALADREGIQTTFVLELAEPDPERLAKIAADMATAKAELAEAEQQAEAGGGLVAALAQTRVMTAKQQIAMLQLAGYQALYGIVIPEIANAQATSVSPTPEGSAVTTAPDETAPESNDEASAAVPEWADPAYPEIDYTNPAFAALSGEGYKLSGYWVIKHSKSKIDDSPEVFAMNAYRFISEAKPEPTLIVKCREGDTSFIFSIGDYLLSDSYDKVRVEFRISQNKAVKSNWSITTSNESVGLWGNKAIKMLQNLIGEKEFFIRATERDGERHQLSVDLSGIDGVIEEVAGTCGWPPVRDDELRTIQAALKAAGFYRGAVDGDWGGGSRGALDAWRAENGIEPGTPLTRSEIKELLGG